MSEESPKPAGIIGWVDLTVPDAEKTRDFYSQVVGWSSQPVSMGDYDDFAMFPPGQEAPAAGICHARGVNAGLPPQWLIYLKVEDLDQSLKRCLELGGKVVVEPKNFGPDNRYCVVCDPAGAHVALFSDQG